MLGDGQQALFSISNSAPRAFGSTFNENVGGCGGSRGRMVREISVTLIFRSGVPGDCCAAGVMESRKLRMKN